MTRTLTALSARRRHPLAVVVLISTGQRSLPTAQGTTLAVDTPRVSATRLASPRRMAAAFAFPRAN